ncbi:MAG: hypothetical protein ACE5DX_04870 [Candidatus Dojkabacteria bacterium]
MRAQKIISSVLVSVFVLGGVFLVPVSAQEVQPEPTTTVTPTLRPHEAIDLKCDLIRDRINNVIRKHKGIMERHMHKYNKIMTLLEKVIKRLEDQGVDVTILKRDLKKLREMVANFKAEYNKFFHSLNRAAKLACSGDREGFIKAIREAKYHLKEVREQAREIREFITGTILPHLRRVKLQISATSID